MTAIAIIFVGLLVVFYLWVIAGTLAEIAVTLRDKDSSP